MKINPAKSVLKDIPLNWLYILQTAKQILKSNFVEHGINTIVRKNESGRIYGITFIDHESRSIWNSSQLDRNLSANLFNNWWNKENKPELKMQDSLVSNTNPIDNESTKDLFEFISQEYSSNFDFRMFSLLLQTQGDNYEEEQFATQMKKRRKGEDCKIDFVDTSHVKFLTYFSYICSRTKQI